MNTIKLVSLNAWGGKVFTPLIEYVREAAIHTDIFCFQEVFHTSSGRTEDDGIRVNLLSELIEALPEFAHFFAPANSGFKIGAVPVDYDLAFGVAIFARRSLPIRDSGTFFTYDRETVIDNRVRLTGVAQYIRTLFNGGMLTICNVHGLWYYSTRGDNDLRLYQSRLIRQFLDRSDGSAILCGDFNLMPDTESMRILQNGYANLVTDYGISSTRSVLYEKDMRLTDYIMASKDLAIQRFYLPDVTVSDHLPLVLEFGSSTEERQASTGSIDPALIEQAAAGVGEVQ